MAKKTATAADVRAWEAATKPKNVTPSGDRGRLPADLVKAYETANPTMKYATAAPRTVKVKVTTINARGRRQTNIRKVETAEARKVLGHEPGRRGRFDKAALSAALSTV